MAVIHKQMNFKKYLVDIGDNSSLSTKAKIHFISGLKESLINEIQKSKKQAQSLPDGSRALFQRFQSSYRGISQEILSTQQRMLQQHKECLEVFNSDPTPKQKAAALHALSAINQKLTSLLNQVKSKKQVIEDLTKGIQDHLRIKKTRIQLQYERIVQQKGIITKDKENKKNTSNFVC